MKETINNATGKREDIFLIAIDHGYSSVKTKHHIFSNGVRKLVNHAVLTENTLNYMGLSYKIGIF